MTVAKLQQMRRLLLGIGRLVYDMVSLIEQELAERGAPPRERADRNDRAAA